MLRVKKKANYLYRIIEGVKMQNVPIGLVFPKWVELGKLNEGEFRRKIAVCINGNCGCGT